MTFTAELKRATDRAHRDAERSTFITRLMDGSESAQAYARLIAQYLPLYRALEEAIVAVRAQHPVSAFYDPRLERSAALRRDLLALGADPSADPLPATAAYVERLRSLTPNEPVRLLAHHYLRYLGDLSGGQVIRTLVRRHYDIAPDALQVWEFSAVGKAKPYKDAYRDKLNSSLSASEQSVFVDECLHGYRLARELFADLAAAPVG